jgi:hypothetical protein
MIKYDDYSDVIHVEPRTWGHDYAAPTCRPWSEGAGLDDDDLSGHFGPEGQMTNAEFEEFLSKARANGQVVEMRAQAGRQRMPSPVPHNGMFNGQQDREAKAYNRKLRQAEKAEFDRVYPEGCSCIRCAAKRAR